MTVSALVVVSGESGLHARPAAEIVKLVQGANHTVSITNQAGKRVSGASLLGILSLGVKAGETIEIEVDGPSADEVLDLLKAVVTG